MFIPGVIISVLTFPGIVVHEFSHMLACKMTKTNVIKTCYFRIWNPAGYVIHEEQKKPWSNLFICVGPFLFNSVISIIAGSVAVLRVTRGSASLLDAVLLWLAVSIGMHSFPSVADAKNIWKNVWSKESGTLPKILGTPIVCFIFVGSFLSMFWLDLLYGVLTGYLVPEFIFNRAAF